MRRERTVPLSLAVTAGRQRIVPLAEVQAELSAFDAQIAQLNQSLADRRPEIAKAVNSTGVLPRTLEANLLGIVPAAPQAGATQAQEGFRVLSQTLFAQ
jgi:hypothetical protein